jgi:hypothetical protein
MDASQKLKEDQLQQKKFSGLGPGIQAIVDLFGGRRITWDDLYKLYENWENEDKYGDPAPFDVWVQKQGRVDPQLVQQFMDRQEPPKDPALDELVQNLKKEHPKW